MHRVLEAQLAVLYESGRIQSSGFSLAELNGWFWFHVCTGGTPFTSTLSFIIFGVGLDDAFIISGACARTDFKKCAAERDHDSIDEVGISVFVTTLTSLTAFVSLNGMATFTRVLCPLDGAPPAIVRMFSTSIIGRSFVIHANSDDLESQPTGNVGPRLALGVIAIGSHRLHQGPGNAVKVLEHIGVPASKSPSPALPEPPAQVSLDTQRSILRMVKPRCRHTCPGLELGLRGW